MPETDTLTRCAADVVAAYVSRTSVPLAELPALLRTVHDVLAGLGQPAAPAVDRIVSFEDGRPYKALRRHLTLRGLTPEAYRAKWGLPVDYPMVSAAYSARRSAISREIGLGQRRAASDALEAA